jgi:hypothetical protein
MFLISGLNVPYLLAKANKKGFHNESNLFSVKA